MARHQPAVAKLADGAEMPLIGLGTWSLTGEAGRRAIAEALEIGYRHIDTASAYGNQREVGAALRDSGVARAEVFLTTKCPPENVGREQETLEESLEQLGVDYVDLWLVHWPPAGESRPDVWAHFVRAQEDGLVRSIGVSNYSIAQIDEITDACGVAPVVNQIPWSPSRYDAELAAALAERKVVLEGYSPFKLTDLANPTLLEVARAHQATTGQVVLRWHLEHGFVAIPKSAHRGRLEENFAVTNFSLSAEETARLDGLANQR
ncbi:MAG: aldo/keto reductase [Actinomycetota bacterium]|nr:aldo/keto reductase [Actinomycetota bacterium]